MALMFVMTPSPIMGGDISLVTALACLKRLLVSGSDTIVTVLGMTSVVSTLSHWLGLVFQARINTLLKQEKTLTGSDDCKTDLRQTKR